MDKIINFELVKNPFNWLIIFAILGFASYAAYVVWMAKKNGLPFGGTQSA